MSEEEAERVELEKVIGSLNQLLSYDYVDLGATPNSIEEEFEIALGLKERIIRPMAMSLRHFDAAEHSADDLLKTPAFSRSRKNESWSISLTDDFVKDTKGIDRKLQGRVLEALLDLVKDPVVAKGNSCKPLVGNLSGLWRLRIGDTRLIYKPDPSRLIVYCLAFTSRGDAYR